MRTQQLRPDELPDELRNVVDATNYEIAELLRAAKELADRENEALKLYSPLPWQEKYHACSNKEVVAVKANQAGGSLMGFVEVARAVTGQDPHRKYPLRDGVAVCLGYGEKHLGRVVHKYLFRPGAFNIIRDEETRRWRPYRPWPREQVRGGLSGDEHRFIEMKPAMPLIPPRFIEGKMAFTKAGEHVFSEVRLTTGWTIYGLNSAGDPSQAQGFQVDLYDIDEDTATEGWYSEAVGRCAIRRGKIRWHALPHGENDELMELIERAEDEERQDTPEAERLSIVIRATAFDNPYYSDESRKANERIWASQGDDVLNARLYGKLTLDSVKMYPTFSPDIHNAIKLEEPMLAVQRVLSDKDHCRFEPPADWTRYMVVDPGHTVCCVSFFTVPPPRDFGDHLIQYDELYLRQCDPVMYGRSVDERTKDRCFEAFIIDRHGGNLGVGTTGGSIETQYVAQHKMLGIRCEQTGNHFRAGSDDVKGRETKLRDLLGIRQDGTTKFLIVVANCPNTVREIKAFKKKTVNTASGKVVLDEGNRKSKAGTHAVECCEYAAAADLNYKKPRPRVNKSTPADFILRERARRARKRRAAHPGSSHITLGPRGNK